MYSHITQKTANMKEFKIWQHFYTQGKGKASGAEIL